MNGILKAMFRRGSALLLTVILLVQLVPVMTAKAADTDLAATVEEQIRAFADSIDKTNADDTAANALAKHGISGGGKTLKVGKSHALTATLMNSKLLQTVLTQGCTAAITAIQQLDLISLPYINGYCTWNGVTGSDYGLYVCRSSKGYSANNRDWYLLGVGAHTRKQNAYDNSLDWMAGVVALYISVERTKTTATEQTYKVTVTAKDCFDFATGSGSGFKDLISGLGALLFREFDWESTATFNLTVPHSCPHGSRAYRWTYDAENHTLTSDGSGDYTENGVTRHSYTNSSGTTSYYHELDETVRLYHNKPWVLEYEIKNPGTFMLAPLPTRCISQLSLLHSGRSSLFVKDCERVVLSEEEMEKYGVTSANQTFRHCYGTSLQNLSPYSKSRPYRFRLENQVNADGSNMLYLTVRRLDTGAVLLDKVPMDDYYLYLVSKSGSFSHHDGDDWVSGKDLLISYIGNKNYRFSADHFELRIWENGEGAEAESLCTKKVTKPTCTAKGYTTYTCTACGYSWKGDTTKAKGHSYKANVTAPTCTTDGYTTYTCSACKDCYTANRISAPGHTLSAGLCTTCGEDTLTAALNGNTLTLSGELDEGTKVIAACYDSSGRFSGTKLFVWQGSELTEKIPGGETVRLFFLDENWSPLRQLIPLS